MKKFKIRKWVKVTFIIVILYLLFSYIDKLDTQAIENCSQTYDKYICEKMVYGY